MKRILVAAAVALIAWFSLGDSIPPAIPRALADPPDPSGALTASPLNYDFTAGEPVVAAPTDYDFANSTLTTHWTIESSGTAQRESSGGWDNGPYLKIVNGSGLLNPKVRSEAFTIDSAAPIFTFYYNTFGVSSANYRVDIAPGPNYNSWSLVAYGTSSVNGWQKLALDFGSYAGQSVKIRYRAYKTVGYDEGATRKIPNWSRNTGKPYWEPGVSIAATTASTGDYTGGDGVCKGAAIPASSGPAARLNAISAIQSDAFTIPTDSNRLSFLVKGEGSGATLNVYVYLASESYATQHIIFSKTIGANGMFTTCAVPSGWAGQDAKVRVRSETGGNVLVAIAGLTSGSLSSKSEIQMDFSSLISGSQMHSHTDLAIPGRGVPLEFTRYYISSAAPVQGSLGWGWTHNFEMGLTIFTSGDVVVRYPNGGRAFFDDDNGDFITPAGLLETLVRNQDDTYTLTTIRAVAFHFDEDGKLTSIVDRNDNTTTLSYTGELLTTVEAPGGLEFTFDYDGSNHLQTLTDPLERTVEFAYDSNNDLTSVTDVKGGVTEFTYDNHRLVTIEDPLNNIVLTDFYDEAGRVAERHDADGGVTCYYYGYGPTYSSDDCDGVSPAPSEGQAVKVDARGNKLTYHFDKSFRTTAIEDALGNVTNYTYEASGALCSPTNNGNRCSISDPLEHVTNFTYDSLGNVLTREDPLEDTWTYTYTDLNDIETVTDPLGRETEVIYDSNGNPTRVVRRDAMDGVEALACLEYDGNGLPTASVASTDLDVPGGPTDQCSGDRTLVDYDTNGWLVCQVNPRFSNTTDTCDEITTKSTFAYDDGGRLVTVTNELRQPVSAPESGEDCGPAGTGDGVDDDSDEVVDDGCPSVIYTYDEQNNVTSITDAEGNVTTYGYDAKGNRTTVTDANRAVAGTAETGASCGTVGTGDGDDDDSDTVIDDGCPSSILGYDAAARLTDVTDALGNVTTLTYDENHNLISVTRAPRQPSGTPETGEDCGSAGTGDGVDDDSDEVVDDGCPSVIYTYDEVNRLESETDGLGRITSYEYWEDSTLTTRTDARSLVTEYTYDSAQQLQLIEYMDGETVIDSVAFDYNEVGSRTEMVDGTGTTSYEYDDLDRLTTVTSPEPKVVSYRYDNTGAQGEDPAEYPGQRTKITYPDSKTAVYTYEADGSMSTVTDWLDNTTTYAYDDTGRLESTELPNGVTTTYGYDDASRLVDVLNEDATPETLSSYEYTLDKVGNRTQVVDTNGTTTYEYDAMYRLTGVTYPDEDEQSYTYDAVGNRLTKVENQTTTEYDYDRADQLLSVDAVSYDYDQNGNTTDRGSDTFEWDYEDRLTSSTIDSVSASFAYNGDGLRMSRTVGMSTVSYVWDVASPTPSILQDSAENTYVYGLDLISRTNSGGDQEYYLYDGLGSTTGLTDDAGNLTDEYQYDVFGSVRAHTGSSPNEFQFTGEQTDSSGLLYLRARYGDLETGRFLSRDPVPYLQRYAYALNNPVNLTDPSGMFAPAIVNPWTIGAIAALSILLGFYIQEALDCINEHVNDGNLDPCKQWLLGIEAVNEAKEVAIEAERGFERVFRPSSHETEARPGTAFAKLTVGEERREHILEGTQDASGRWSGGHRCGTPRASDKTSQFPASWGDDQIIDSVESIANDRYAREISRIGRRVTVESQRGGVVIQVIIDEIVGIVTGFPTEDHCPENQLFS